MNQDRLPQVEHETEEFGADYPDYKVEVRCRPNCPACIRDLTASIVAGEIFSEIEKDGNIAGKRLDEYVRSAKWQALKSKYGIGG